MLTWDGRQMLPECEVYSDVSCRHGAIGYCCGIIQGDAGVRYLTGDLTDCGSVTAGEIIALALGIENCLELSRGVVAHTDLDWLPACMNGKRVSYQDKIEAALSQLRTAASGCRYVVWKRVLRSHSTYRKCHRQSRHQAILAAQKRGTFGRFTDGVALSEGG